MLVHASCVVRSACAPDASLASSCKIVESSLEMHNVLQDPSYPLTEGSNESVSSLGP